MLAILVAFFCAALATSPTKCLKNSYVVTCASQCKVSLSCSFPLFFFFSSHARLLQPSPQAVCVSSCRAVGRSSGHCRRACVGNQDSCINACVLANEVRAGCIKPNARRAARLASRRARRASRRRGGRRRSARRSSRRSSRRAGRRSRRNRRRSARRARRARRAAKKLFRKSGRKCAKSERRGLRARLVSLSRTAAACGDEDSKCVDAAYKSIADVKRRIVACGGKVKARRCRTSCSAKCVSRLASRLARLQKKKCDDLDHHCIRTHLRRLLASHRRVARCNKKTAVVAKAPAKKALAKCSKWVHASEYRRAVTCDRLNIKFKAWLSFTKCRRLRAFQQSHRCPSSNTACLRHAYRQILRIQNKLTAASDEFVRLVSRCDECAPLKMRFYKWLQKQRRRRHRAHLRACACGALDVECLADNVATIKRIQDRITLRRTQVLALHGQCSVKHGFSSGTFPDYATTALGAQSTTTTTATTAAGAASAAPLPTAAPVAVAGLAAPAVLTASVVRVDQLGSVPAPGEIRLKK